MGKTFLEVGKENLFIWASRLGPPAATAGHRCLRLTPRSRPATRTAQMLRASAAISHGVLLCSLRPDVLARLPFRQSPSSGVRPPAPIVSRPEVSTAQECCLWPVFRVPFRHSPGHGIGPPTILSARLSAARRSANDPSCESAG